MIRVSNDLGQVLRTMATLTMIKMMIKQVEKQELIFPHKETLEESQDSGCGSGNDTQVRISRE